MAGLSVTVLMTVYNGGQHLSQSIESVLKQTYKDFEFLIIDDCSTDESLKTIESFNDERIKIHHNSHNLGQTKSLNIGLKIASGEYIARIDADDIALPRWVETQIDQINKHPDCSVVSVYVFAIDEHNKVKKLYKPPLLREDIILRSLVASPINHVGSVFKKSDIIKNGGYDERYMTAADYDLWGKLISNNYRITTTPKILMAIREHAHSLSRSERGKRGLRELIEIVAKNIKKFTNAKFSNEEIRLFCRVNYDEYDITAAEFEKAIEMTKKVYMGLASSLAIKRGKMARWTHNRCVTLYLKRIFSAINRKDYGAVRRFSLEAMKEFGPLSTFIFFWSASLLGGVVLSFIPVFYNNFLRRIARCQLGFPMNSWIFH